MTIEDSKAIKQILEPEVEMAMLKELGHTPVCYTDVAGVWRCDKCNWSVLLTPLYKNDELGHPGSYQIWVTGKSHRCISGVEKADPINWEKIPDILIYLKEHCPKTYKKYFPPPIPYNPLQRFIGILEE